MAWQLALAPGGELLSWAAPYVCLCGALLVRADSDVFVSVAQCSLLPALSPISRNIFPCHILFWKFKTINISTGFLCTKIQSHFLEQFSFDKT